VSGTVILVDALPPGSTGTFARYDHRATAPAGWRFCDVRQIIFEQQDAWLSDLDAWSRQLSAVASRTGWRWWLLPAARFMIWLPVNLKPLLFARGIVEYLRRHQEATLHVMGAPDEVVAYLQEWTAQPSGEASAIVDRRVRERLGAGARMDRFRALMAAALRVRSLIETLLRRDAGSGLAATADVLVVSHTLNAAVVRRFGDHYFGSVFDDPAFRNLRVHWFYHLSAAGDAATIRAHCASLGRVMRFDADWLRWRDLPAVVFRAVGCAWTFRKPLPDMPSAAVGGCSTRGFLRAYLRRGAAWYPPIAELAAYAAYRRCLAQVRPRVVIYPFEQKGLERVLVHACRQQPQPVKVIGFAHAAFAAGHRYFQFAPLRGEPMPDVLAVTGPAQRQWLQDHAQWPADRLRSIGSPRTPPTPMPMTPHGGPLQVLMVVGIGSELELLASFAESCPGMFDGCALTIRRYPYAWHDAQNRGLARLADLGVAVTLVPQPLDEQLRAADVVLFSSTSVGIEAMLHGRATIRVSLEDIIDSDPIAGRGDNGAMLRAQNGAELRDHLRRLAAAISAGTLDALVTRQRHFAGTIYAPVDTTALARFLEEPAS
jgi:hypothetical protein